VVVRDGNGHIIGAGQLRNAADDLPSDGVCRYSYGIEVPDSKFYAIQFGSQAPVVVTKAQMISSNYIVNYG